MWTVALRCGYGVEDDDDDDDVAGRAMPELMGEGSRPSLDMDDVVVPAGTPVREGCMVDGIKEAREGEVATAANMCGQKDTVPSYDVAVSTTP